MTTQTPAVERAARALGGVEPDEEWPTNEALGGGLTGTRDDEYRDGLIEQAHHALTAALTDSDDPDFLARTLYVRHGVVMFGVTESRAREAWARLVLTIRGRAEQEQWRAVADGLRSALLNFPDGTS